MTSTLRKQVNAFAKKAQLIETYRKNYDRHKTQLSKFDLKGTKKMLMDAPLKGYEIVDGKPYSELLEEMLGLSFKDDGDINYKILKVVKDKVAVDDNGMAKRIEEIVR